MSEPFESSRRSDLSNDDAPMSAFLPVLILSLVLLGWFGFQALQLRIERAAINEAMTNQEKTVNDSKKLRDSFYAIAHGAEVLADAGNSGARLVVDGLKKRGITITPNPPPPGAEAPATPAR